MEAAIELRLTRFAGDFGASEGGATVNNIRIACGRRLGKTSGKDTEVKS